MCFQGLTKQCLWVRMVETVWHIISGRETGTCHHFRQTDRHMPSFQAGRQAHAIISGRDRHMPSFQAERQAPAIISGRGTGTCHHLRQRDRHTSSFQTDTGITTMSHTTLTRRQATIDDCTLFVHTLQLSTNVVDVILAEAHNAIAWTHIFKLLCK